MLPQKFATIEFSWGIRGSGSQGEGAGKGDFRKGASQNGSLVLGKKQENRRNIVCMPHVCLG